MGHKTPRSVHKQNSFEFNRAKRNEEHRPADPRLLQSQFFREGKRSKRMRHAPAILTSSRWAIATRRAKASARFPMNWLLRKNSSCAGLSVAFSSLVILIREIE